MSDLVYKLGKDSYLLVPVDLISHLEKFQQLSSTDPEKGGLLIGIYRSPHIELTQMSKPQKEDSTSRFEFIRRSKRHLNIAIKAWRDSNKIETYMGEWHTHPEDHPVPSSIDIKEWKDKLPKNKVKVLIIVGRVSNWYGYWNGKIIIKLRCESDS